MPSPKLSIFKFGSGIMQDAELLQQFLNIFCKHSGHKILVHGGGKTASSWSQQMGITVNMHQGRRITDNNSIDVVTAVYAGLVNKQLVAQLQKLNCNALGLSGADGNAIESVKRPVKAIDYGFVGDIVSVNNNLITTLLANNLVPVFNAITHDNNGLLLNTNGDAIAANIAKSFADSYSVALYYCFELPGVLSDINNLNSVITEIKASDVAKLLDAKILSKGMLPKITNAIFAKNSGVKSVYIGSTQMFSDSKIYTTIN